MGSKNNFLGTTMHEVKWRAGSTMKSFKFMEVRVSGHKRSNRWISFHSSVLFPLTYGFIFNPLC